MNIPPFWFAGIEWRVEPLGSSMWALTSCGQHPGEPPTHHIAFHARRSGESVVERAKEVITQAGCGGSSCSCKGAAA